MGGRIWSGTERARALRQRMTEAEVALWALLRGGRAGAKFRRQHPIGPFVLDFFCHAASLAVEVDGPSHQGRAARDHHRDLWLRGRGIEVLRVRNAQVLRRPQSVLDAIRDRIAARSAGPSPSGEGQLDEADIPEG